MQPNPSLAGAIVQVRTPFHTWCMVRLAHHASTDAMHGADAMVHACMVQVRTPCPVIRMACILHNTFFALQTRKTEVEARRKKIISQPCIGKALGNHRRVYDMHHS